MTGPGDGLTTAAVDRFVADADTALLPGYVHDLTHLDAHVAAIRAALDAPGVAFTYAVKANPDARLLPVILRHAHGLEVASGGELAHVRSVAPGAWLALGGPGKTDEELAAAVAAGVDRIHVESRHELRRLDAAARAAGVVARVLLRVNLPVRGRSAVLVMGGGPSPFGMDPADADAAVGDLEHLPGVELVGVHAHLGSGLDATASAAQAATVLDWAVGFARRHRVRLREVGVGGGMDVDYRDPTRIFDWPAYGRALAAHAAAARTHLGSELVVRIEPGRAVTAYSGWYVSRVLDVKTSRGRSFAVCAGGTHHLRTPAAKGHDQPMTVVPGPDGRQAVPGPVTFVGQLCTPKDVLARDVPIPGVAVGDRVVFALAGAYAWNISHHSFLMHPPPTQSHLG